MEWRSNVASPLRPASASSSRTGRYGEVFDRGYRHYEGEREGRWHAVRALIIYSIKRGLGIKKRWTAKIIPIALYTFAFLPVIVIVGVRALVGRAASGFSYGTLYSAISLILLVFAAATAPEMLCEDRRENVLALYFSRPITRADYLLGKIAALGILMGSIALLPALILFFGTTLLAPSPLSYFGNHVGDIGRIVALGVSLSIFYAAIGLVIAAYTNRKGIASAIYIGLVLVESGIIGALQHAFNASQADYLSLIDLGVIPTGLQNWILGPAAGQGGTTLSVNLNGVLFLYSLIVVALICVVVMYRRYLVEE